METKSLLVALLILLLAITTIIFGVRSATNAAQAEAAYVMSGALVTQLQAEKYHQTVPLCRGIAPGKYQSLQECLVQIINITDFSAFFREDTFQNPSVKNELKGYLVIENEKGGKTFQSGSFELYKNNELAATGCTTPDEIKPGFTCRLDFSSPCLAGDNLEVRYEGKRAHLKTC